MGLDENWAIIAVAYAGKPLLQSISETFKDFFDATVGIRAKTFKAKKEIDNEAYLTAYRENVQREILKTDPENMKEPDLYIVGPALEASKFYIEEKELREMFSKLIANNMDRQKTNEVHPSFVEIIKQCSKLDALILKSFRNVRTFPIYSLRIMLPGNCHHDIVKDFYLNEAVSSFSLPNISQSISNLQRLGLVEISNENMGEPEELEKYPRVGQYLNSLSTNTKDTQFASRRMDVTPYGEAFISVCIQERD